MKMNRFKEPLINFVKDTLIKCAKFRGCEGRSGKE